MNRPVPTNSHTVEESNCIFDCDSGLLLVTEYIAVLIYLAVKEVVPLLVLFMFGMCL